MLNKLKNLWHKMDKRGQIFTVCLAVNTLSWVVVAVIYFT